ncbi:hypothetical protein SNE40_020108 [Patella caerulea]|uniref:F-actin monooxygenase n=1 Tax=Patella caerulea TaxID=87958 RepID=A0AAN8IZA8_PATCE
MNGVSTEELASKLFDQFVSAVTCKSVLNTFHELCSVLGLLHVDHHNFYRLLKSRLTSWRAKSIWDKFDKRAAHRDYKRAEACRHSKVLVIGAGPCGLRMAIEIALLGGKAVVVEKRDRFSRNNVLHLWPFLITDLKNLGAKKFFGKFAAGAIDHISIRQLQCILLKVALLLGVEVHVNVGFGSIVEPPEDQTNNVGWRCTVDPANHPVSEYQFDVLVGADGKRNTLSGFKRKEFRGKLAIAITANFINKNTTAEASVEEISGVAFIFNQKFFLDLKDKTGIDLENIVYYKDETHYFVMTAKKQSLLYKGVLKEDYADTIQLLSRENVNHDALLAYATEAADVSTNYQLPNLEYAVNHYGQADVAMFDFTSMFAAENSCRAIEKYGHKLLIGIVGDSLLEPFWPTGSGCARGFLGVFDTAWMIKNWAAGKMTPLEVIAERESIFQLLSQTTPERLHKSHHQYSIDPNTRYPNLNTCRIVKPFQVRHLYDGGDATKLEEEIPSKRRRHDEMVDGYSLLRWCQKVLNNNIYRHVHIIDFTTSWRNGLALCALIHVFRPELINFNQLLDCDVLQNNQLAFSLAETELGIQPVMTAEDMVNCDVPDRLNMMVYLSQFYRAFKAEPLPLVPITRNLSKDEKNIRSPKHRTSFLQKLSSRIKSKRKKDDEPEKLFKNKSPEEKLEQERNVALTKYNKLPMDEIANKLTVTEKKPSPYAMKSKEEATGAVSVNAMAEILAAKFRGDPPVEPQPPLKKMKGQPTLLAAQPNSEFCKFCAKRVYIMERMSAEGVFFHRGCLKCDFCGTNLRLNNYSCEREPDVRFFCFRHALIEQRLNTKRKRNNPYDDDESHKENVPKDKDSSPSIDMTDVDPIIPIIKTPDSILSPLRVKNHDLLAKNSRTPERVEFENTFDGLEEETEEEQIEHNLRASLSSDTLLDDEEYDSSNSDSESGAEDEDVLLDVEEGLGNQSITWEEACQLAKTWSTRHSTDNLKQATEEEEETPYTKLEEDDDDDDDTEVEDSEYESEDDTETEEELAVEEKKGINISNNHSSPIKSPLSPSGVIAARASFFSSPPQVVRIDPFSMFKNKETKKQEDEDVKIIRAADDVASEEKDDLSEKDEDSRCLASESISEDISTDKSKVTVMSVGELESTEEEMEEGESSDECKQDGDDEEGKSSQQDTDVDEDELLGKTAVGKEMERILAEIDKDDSISDSEQLGSITEPLYDNVQLQPDVQTVEDEVFVNLKEKHVEKEKTAGVDLDTATSGDTLKQVLDSVRNMETSSDDENERKKDLALTMLDEKFVTDRRRKKGKRIKRSESVSSESSFTISTPSGSPKSSASSLADVMENNKVYVDNDDKPDVDMLRDYTTTLSMVLDEESDNDNPPVITDNPLADDKDTTIYNEDEDADNTLETNNSSIYFTPELSAIEDKFNTPVEDTDNIVITSMKPPVVNLHKHISHDNAKEQTKVSENVQKHRKDVNHIPGIEHKENITNKPIAEIKSAENKTKDQIKGGKCEDIGKKTKVLSEVTKEGIPDVLITSPKSPPNPTICESQFTSDINRNNKISSSTPLKNQPIKPTSSSTVTSSTANTKEKKPLRKLPDLPPVNRWTPGRSPVKPSATSTSPTKPISTALNTPNALTVKPVSTPFFTPVGKPVKKTQNKPVSRSSSNSSVSDSGRSRSGSLTRRKGVHVDKTRTKIALDRNKLLPNPKTISKPSSSEKSFPAEKGRKKIQLDSSLTEGDTLKREIRKSTEEYIDDIPFADDGDNDSDDIFSTPATSIKRRPVSKVHNEDMNKQVKKRLLPVPPVSRVTTNTADNKTSKVTKTDRSKPSSSSTDTAVVFLNKTYGSPSVVVRNPKTKDTKSDPKKDSDNSSVSSARYTKKKLKTTDSKLSNTPKTDPKVKLRKSEEKSDSDSQSKKEKRKSLLAMLKPNKSPEKSKSVSDINTPQSSANSKSKSKKGVKSESKIDKKKGKLNGGKDGVDTSLCDNMKGLEIGSSSVFTSNRSRKPLLSTSIHAPTADIDEFSDSDESIMSTSTVHSRKRDNYMSMSLDPEADARRARRIQRKIDKQQKLNEQKRLRMAQELQRQLEEVEVKQRELEERGIQVEKDLRESGKDDADLMQEWFNLVHEKNTIVRFESSLMIQARELELEDRQARLNGLLRDRMSIEDGPKDDSKITEEKKILDELLQVVEQRDSLVAMLEEDRLREKAEDRDLEEIMQSKGFALSPMSYVKDMKSGIKANGV